ncbi:MAG: DUF4388 domain-containing protein [Polyangiaceae bacterium]
MASSTHRASSSATGGRILNGRIEAIGVFDLLRVAVTQKSTGKLLLCNEEHLVELYYESGSLVQARSNDKRGMKALLLAMSMSEGEFEYVSDQILPGERIDGRLHDTMMLAITEHYRELVSARRSDSGQPPAHRGSGVHRVGTQREASQEQAAARLCRGELGRGVVDSAGRTQATVGAIEDVDLGCAAKLADLSYELASAFGFSRLERFEVRRGHRGGLLCRLARDGIRVARIDHDPELERIWLELEP